MQLTIAQDVASLQGHLSALARQGSRIAFVPTMGALHDGHLELIKQAKKLAPSVVVSIFVNPKQFGPGEDFQAYPRDLKGDLEKVRNAGATLVYTPSPEDVYPLGFATSISAGEIGSIMEGRFRPGHFDGVATVVTKLLLRVLPHVALFGEKDYQQLCVIRRVVRDLDMPIEIVGIPTVREFDGLAMSSRNAYLTQEERKIASRLYEALKDTAERIIKDRAAEPAIRDAVAALTKNGFKVDYIELCAADTLKVLSRPEKGARLLAAAWLGKTRLIDNLAIG